MTLVDDYLRAVAALLPRDDREDITAELRDLIMNRIEAREAELGRAPNSDEIEAILRDIGHPLVVAARYRNETQHVIGPALYPFWYFTVKIAVLIQAAVALVVMVIRTLAGQPFGLALGDALAAAFTGAIMLIGLITVAAWLIERFKVRLPYLKNWRVRDLKVFEYADWDLDVLKSRFQGAKAARPAHPARLSALRHTRLGLAAEGLAAVAWGSVFALWWIGALRFGVVGSSDDLHQLGLSPGDLSGIDWLELRAAIFWPVLALVVLFIISGASLLANPRAPALRGLFKLAQGLGTLALCAWLWTASPVSGAIQVGSLSELMVQVQTALQNSPPLDLAPLVTLILGVVALGAVGNLISGAWFILARPEMRDDATGRAAAA